MSVLLIVRYDLQRDAVEAYTKWSKFNKPKLQGAPGLDGYEEYRAIAGTSSVMVQYQFADLASFALWRANEDVALMFVDILNYVENMSIDLWGDGDAEIDDDDNGWPVGDGDAEIDDDDDDRPWQ